MRRTHLIVPELVVRVVLLLAHREVRVSSVVNAALDVEARASLPLSRSELREAVVAHDAESFGDVARRVRRLRFDDVAEVGWEIRR